MRQKERQRKTDREKEGTAWPEKQIKLRGEKREEKVM